MNSKTNDIEEYMTLQITMYIEIDTFKDEEKIINDCRRINRTGTNKCAQRVIQTPRSDNRTKKW